MDQAPSEITREVNRAIMIMGGISFALLIGITLVMIWFAVRYRRGKAHTTKQIRSNLAVEVIWVVIPTLIVAWMFFLGYKGFAMIRRVPDNAKVVQVTGQQWSWSFGYPEEGITSTTLVVPVNTPIKAELSAPPEDVVHSFYLPAFRVKEDVVPGQKTHLWFESEREGTFNIFCAEYCGKDHSKMIAEMRVVSQEEYKKWVRDQINKRFKPLEWDAVADPDHPAFKTGGELSINAERMYNTFCASCHGANGDGSGLPEARDFRSAEGWKKGTKVTDIYRVLTEGIPDTQMRAFPNLSAWEKVGLAHYVRSFLKTEPPADTEEDYQALVAEYDLDKMQVPKEALPIDKAMELLIKERGGKGDRAAGRDSRTGGGEESPKSDRGGSATGQAASTTRKSDSP